MTIRRIGVRLAVLGPYALVAVSGLLAVWMIAAHHAGQGAKAPGSDVSRFQGFSPHIAGWQARAVKLATDSLRPDIVAYRFTRTTEPDRSVSVLVRLVHGYNMVDCMRIKGYAVAAVNAPLPAPESAPTAQYWQLVDRGGGTSQWVTVMLRATDLAATDLDTRAMAFPRVGQPDDLGWNPTGLKWSSFRHPVSNFRLWLRARWNGSRCDWLTFLRLKRPAWVSDKYYTLVAEGPDLKSPADAEIHRRLLQALIAAFGDELRQQITHQPRDGP